MRGHFADCLLIPAALPLVLWLQRRLALRTHDGAPTGGEILLHLAIWAFIAEGAGPWLTHHGTADPWDVLSYAAGAAVGYVFWHRREMPCRAGQSPVTPSPDAPQKNGAPPFVTVARSDGIGAACDPGMKAGHGRERHEIEMARPGAPRRADQR